MDAFEYERRPSLTSYLWHLWLQTPLSFRFRVYRLLLLVLGSRDATSPDILHLPFSLDAKVGGQGTIQEALTIQFVAKHTTIPVPTALDVFRDPSAGDAFFLMARPPGTPLEHMEYTLDSVTPEQLTVFADTMRDWLNQLQYLRSPYGRPICGFLGHAFKSDRINPLDFVGPYDSQDRFHEEPCCATTDEHDPRICSLAAIIRQKRYEICFVHGNISPDNVLVDRQYRPVGLVGWGCAAWMPEYWELTSAVWQRRRVVYPGWTQALVRALPQHTDELKVERELWRTYTPL